MVFLLLRKHCVQKTWDGELNLLHHKHIQRLFLILKFYCHLFLFRRPSQTVISNDKECSTEESGMGKEI